MSRGLRGSGWAACAAWLALALHVALGSVLPAELGARLVAAAERPCEGDGKRPAHAQDGWPAPAIVVPAAAVAVLPPGGPALPLPRAGLLVGGRGQARPRRPARRRERAQARAPPGRAVADRMRRARAP